MKRLAAAAALALLFGAGPAVARDDFISGVWFGEAHPTKGGPFTHCAVTATYENGIDVSFIITRRYEFWILLYSAAWSLTEADRYTVVFAIDSGERHRAKALAIDEHTVHITLPSTRAMLDRLRAGSALSIEAAGGRFRFDLGGSSLALQALLDCVNRNVQVTGPGGRNPFAGEGPGRSGPSGGQPQQRRQTPEPRAEATPRGAARLDDRRHLVQIAAMCAVGSKVAYFDDKLVPLAEGAYDRIDPLSAGNSGVGRAANERIGRALPAMLDGQ